MIKTIYRLPVHWASALINDDYSGIDDTEKAEIRKFLEKAEGRPVSVDFTTEGFTIITMPGHWPAIVPIFYSLKINTQHYGYYSE